MECARRRCCSKRAGGHTSRVEYSIAEAFVPVEVLLEEVPEAAVRAGNRVRSID